jgi:transposase, IS30 family
MKGYTQLTREQRYQIHALLQKVQRQTQIATVLGVHTATISREIRRNGSHRGYRPRQAHRLTHACQKIQGWL